MGSLNTLIRNLRNIREEFEILLPDKNRIPTLIKLIEKSDFIKGRLKIIIAAKRECKRRKEEKGLQQELEKDRLQTEIEEKILQAEPEGKKTRLQADIVYKKLQAAVEEKTLYMEEIKQRVELDEKDREEE